MNRKDEHVSLAKAFYQKQANDFDFVRPIHHSLSSIKVAAVALTTQLGPWQLTSPFYINAMTGGSQKTTEINHQLALLAKEMNLVMATGSVTAALKNPAFAESFQIVRKTNPKGIIWANVGAGSSVENAQRAVDLLEADALQIHLNIPQELVMPEGDRDFSQWLTLLEATVKQVNVPVIVKEVGFGMSQETIRQLVDCGVTMIDVSGQGGTSFTQLENQRRPAREFDYLADWGQSTVISLLEAQQVKADVSYLASGGVRNALDIFKALALGAQAVGVSGTILNHLLTHGLEATVTFLQQWQNELKTLYALTNHTTTADVRSQQLLLSGSVKEWCDARQIDWRYYANR